MQSSMLVGAARPLRSCEKVGGVGLSRRAGRLSWLWPRQKSPEAGVKRVTIAGYMRRIRLSTGVVIQNVGVNAQGDYSI